MIKKFLKISQIGRFTAFSPSGDQTLRKLNLIFGENGRGKTTITSILRSFRSGDPSPMRQRKTLGASSGSCVEILLDSGTAKFDGAAWDVSDSSIEIFDGKFVVENIYVGDSVETQNKRGLASVILGQRGTQISLRIKEQDEIAKDKGTAIRTDEENITRYIPSVVGVPIMALEKFATLPNEPDIDEKIKNAERAFEAAQRAASLRLQSTLQPLPVPHIPEAFSEALAQTLENVSAAAEKQVREHIKSEHVLGAEKWLSQGVPFMDGPTCPVCGQDVSGIDLIGAYKSFFSTEYAALRDRIARLESQLSLSLGDDFSVHFQQTVRQNEAALAYWSELLPLSVPRAPDSSRFKSEVEALLTGANELLALKKGSLLESVPVASLDGRTAALETATAEITAYNVAVSTANTLIEELKGKTAAADPRALRTTLDQLKAVKARHDTTVADLFALRETHKTDRERAVEARATAQKELAEYSSSVVGACESRINEILSDFGADFRICDVATSFPAGTAASTYCVEINGESVEVGKTRDDAPSFRTMLSAGDRSALALAFFFAALDQDASKSSKIVVLDDPFHSQDEYRRNQTAKLIAECVSECQQVIITSHDANFLRLVWDVCVGADAKCLKLSRSGVDDTIIEEWDVVEATRHPFQRLHEDLTNYLAGTVNFASTDAIQKPRVLLEDYLRFRFPNTFKWNDWLNDMIEHFAAQGPNHPMSTHIQALRDINDYTKGSHHTSSSIINETALKTHIKKTLEIVGNS